MIVRSSGCIKSLALNLRSCCKPRDLPLVHQIHATILQTPLSSKHRSYLENLLIQMYGRCGNLSESIAVFQYMDDHRRDIFSWNLMLAAHTQNSPLFTSKRFFDAMAERDVVSWTTILSAATRKLDDLHCARAFLERMPQWCSVSWNAMLSAYAHAGDPLQAVAIFHRIPQRNIVSWNGILAAQSSSGDEVGSLLFDRMPGRDVISYSIQIAAYARDGQSMPQARDLFDAMPEPYIPCWNAMITGYAMAEDIDQAMDLFHRMPSKSIVSWNAIALAYARSGHIAQARQVFDEMDQRDAIAWASMVDAYAAKGFLRYARETLERMPCWDLVPVTSMIQGCGEIDLGLAKSLFDAMPHRNFITWSAMAAGFTSNAATAELLETIYRVPRQDVVLWTLLLQIFSESSDFESAQRLFQWMPESDVVASNVMIVANAQHGDLDRAKLVFDRMPGYSVVSWSSLIQAYALHGFAEESTMIFQEMPARNEGAWTGLIRAHLQAGDPPQAQGAFEKMPFHTEILANLLLASHLQLKNADEATDLFHRIHGGSTATPSWNALISMHASKGRSSDAMDLLAAMSCDGLLPDSITFITLLGMCAHLGLVREGCQIFQEMVGEHGVVPDDGHYSCLVDGLARVGRLDYAQGMLAAIPGDAVACAWTSLLTGCVIHRDMDRASTAAGMLIQLATEGASPYIALCNQIPWV